MPFQIQPYDVLQIKRPGRDWSDYVTLRTAEDGHTAVRIVDGLAHPSGTDSSMGWRIRRVNEDRTVYRRFEDTGDAIPMRTICAHCESNGRPTTVMVDVPEDARGISHGICSECATIFIEEAQRTSGVVSPEPTPSIGTVIGPDPRD